MAGGIDWFRWHHGTVTDQKFPLIARKAGASVAEVIAVWACLLESASMNAELRGHIGGAPDFEAMDCALGMEEGRAELIFSAMTGRGLMDSCGHISAWPKRQPKREREDDNSTKRVQAFRQKQRQETPGNASEGSETPRGEESREDKQALERAESVRAGIEAEGHKPTPAGAACLAMRQAGLSAVNPGDPRLLALLTQGATPEELASVAADAVSKGKGFAWALKALEGRRADALAISLAPRASITVPHRESAEQAARRAEQEQRTAELAQVDPAVKARIAERLAQATAKLRAV